MIDTLRISLNETHITDSADLTVIPGSVEFSTGLQSESELFVTDSGKIITGKKAYLNTDLYNLTILPKHTVSSDFELNRAIKYINNRTGFTDHLIIKENVNFRSNSRIYLQTSLPKVNNYIKGSGDYNLNPVAATEIPGLIKFIYKDLTARGITTDFDGSEISRLDIFNNIQTDLSYNEYSPIFNQLEFSRKRNINFGGETFLYYNKSGELCVYDKTKEMELKNVKAPDNIMRFEYRNLNKRSYFNRYKTSSLQSILNYPEMKKELINLGNMIFDKKKFELNKLDPNSIRLILLQKKALSRFWLRDFFYNEGINFVLENIDKNILLDILKDLLTKDKFYKIKREINGRRFSNSILNNTRRLDLFNEIKEKYFTNLEAA